MDPLLVAVIALAVVAVVAAGGAGVLLAKLLLPKRRNELFNQAVDHAITYAEQVTKGKAKAGQERFVHAVACARDELKAHSIKFTEAELGRRIEIRLGVKK